ncbi:hypothetical protein PoMZ_00879 [Pyricularia oryzae]|uniref:Uncharacterized protein n=1 Tax=Pyricularia oryzae TaxID=318829 RepID=A0A4P7N1B1_PYROR|nr:hypothetical protein PoMZ_00879 [Pyricularia oryzae]
MSARSLGHGTHIDNNLFDTAGESGDDTDMSAYAEEYDEIRLPVDDLRGASSAMTQSTQGRRTLVQDASNSGAKGSPVGGIL